MEKIMDKNALETPPWLRKYIIDTYNPTWDLCASKENAMLPNFFSKDNSCLDKDWHKLEGVLFINPEYGKPKGSKPGLKNFMIKLQKEVLLGARVVALVPIQTMMNEYFNEKLGFNVTMIKGRIKFYYNGKVTGDGGQFNNVLIEYTPETIARGTQEFAIVSKNVLIDRFKNSYK